MASPLKIYDTTVSSDWIDFNQHMTEGYYGVVFSNATDALLFHIGVEEYLARTQCTFYTVETHILYKKELKMGAPLSCETIVLGANQMQLHIFHRLLHATEGYEAATYEGMLLHVNQAQGGLSMMAADMWQTVERLAKQHSVLPMPQAAGQSITKLRR